MRLNVIADKLRGALETWGATVKARVLVARDPLDVLSILYAGPRGAVIVLHYAGGSPNSAVETDETDGIDDNNVVHQVADEKFEISIGQAMGMDAAKDINLMAAVGAERPALLRRVNDLRARVLALVFPDDQTTLRRFRWLGTDTVTLPDGFPLAAYRLFFALTAVVDVEDNHINVQI